jgi:hypothetical protein
MTFSMDADNQMLLVQAAQFIKDSEISKWRISISPESMAMTDYSQLRMERTEYINALGIFLQSSYPIAERFPQATPILLELLKWGLAGFKGSKEIEGVIEKVIAQMEQAAQQAQQGGGDQQQQDPKVQKQQLEMQQSQMEHQQNMQESNQKHQLKMTEMMMGFKAEMQEIMARMQEGHNKLMQKIGGNTSDMLTAPPMSLGPTPPPGTPPTPQPPPIPGVPSGITSQ